MRHATGMRSLLLGAAGFLLMMAWYGIGAGAPRALAVVAALLGIAAVIVGVIAWLAGAPGRAQLQLVTIGALLGLFAVIPLLHALLAR